ncbi:hypothetical protein JJB11_06230 [Ramlibacter ginsenosidimutans]|uniref:Uncharacterized protein n=1 Tax=Ramlibacter ginsenosidimutans TaxID=502333 RepID=A0A934TRP5_9BURK|nr:hypothetical protein [Ramlibacter ginsenosidimutans]MBK6005686.1 hypothetical protein [Ramlibacter ginsenosidimutans]
MFNWFSGKKAKDAQHSALPSSGMSRLESTKPYHQTRHGSGGRAQPANRKQERLERRELLYAVVRESMVRAGVLSSSYKFKVLSLDQRGRQFMVMVDLSQGSASDTRRLAEIEAMVAQSAKSRYDILVSAVYWRANDHVASGDPERFAAPRVPGQPGSPDAMHSGPVPLDPGTRPAQLEAASPERPRPRVDPLQAEEVTAFRKALAAGVRGEQALASANRGAQPQRYTLLTGFEDTEMASGVADDVGEHLSGTQYGALR